MNKSAIKKFAIWARGALHDAVRVRALALGITEAGAAGFAGTCTLTPQERTQRAALLAQIQRRGFAQVMEDAACLWFSRFIALRYMEVNGYLPSFPAGEGKLRRALLAQCDALGTALPELFGDKPEYAALLLPETLLGADGIPGRMAAEIPEEDWRDGVQIIGWLYQYYNSPVKDETFALLKKNVKISRERIPAATQLFTPDWIVQYMVENSLGRLWHEHHPGSDTAAWQYYLARALQPEAAPLRPEDIRVLDPCMGCGHILVYAFDVLLQLYRSCGWPERDAALSILRNNLFGLDIDGRVCRLAQFALMMKARRYVPDLFESGIQPHLAHFGGLPGEGIPEGSGGFAAQFAAADTCGSLLEPALPASLREMPADGSPLGRMVRIARMLGQRYDVVVTNPPYMGGSGMNAALAAFVREHYPDSKSDLFAVFMERCAALTKENGYCAMITQHAWMFLSSYERLREKLLSQQTLTSLLHLGMNAFDTGEVGTIVQVCAFVLRNAHYPGYRSTFLRLTHTADKAAHFRDADVRFVRNVSGLRAIPGMPLAYWASEQALALFRERRVQDYATAVQGMTTSDNRRFLRLWFEADRARICWNAADRDAARRSGKKWFPYNKGGGCRKWYGNHEYIINYENDGAEIRAFHEQLNKTSSGGRIKNTEYYFRRCITWSFIALTPTFRQCGDGFLFDVAGSSVFCDDAIRRYLLAFLCSNTAAFFMDLLNPTMNIQAKDVKALPLRIDPARKSRIEALVEENIALSREDWDAFETSWDFRGHPLIPQEAVPLQQCFQSWQTVCDARFRRLRRNEEELNRIFIDIYDLQGELSPAIAEKEVTVRRADPGREIRSLLSYAVGCLLGRYSLDEEGVVYAGGTWEPARYRTILPAADGILPLYAEDGCGGDVVSRVEDFVRIVYGEETFEENLAYIADGLGGRGTSRARIRSYFQNGFYADHCRGYQKRPIYWLFDSGRLHSFRCLVYLHRLDAGTLAAMRTDYVLPLLERCHARLQAAEGALQTAPPAERAGLLKRAAQLHSQSEELLAYDEKLRRLAEAGCTPDLDAGVRANYEAYGDVVAKVR